MRVAACTYGRTSILLQICFDDEQRLLNKYYMFRRTFFFNIKFDLAAQDLGSHIRMFCYLIETIFIKINIYEQLYCKVKIYFQYANFRSYSVISNHSSDIRADICVSIHLAHGCSRMNRLFVDVCINQGFGLKCAHIYNYQKHQLTSLNQQFE